MQNSNPTLVACHAMEKVSPSYICKGKNILKGQSHEKVGEIRA
jgi:hypothetical protein